MSSSAFTHPFLSALLGDDETAGFFSVEADIAAMLAFERALANAEAAAGLIPVAAAERIGEVCTTFVPDMSELRGGTAKDGVVVPELVRQLRLAVGTEYESYVHFGATSQDVIDTGLVLRLQQVCRMFLGRLSDLDEGLQRLQDQFGSQRMMGRTRMQAALPITVEDRLRAWREPLLRHRQRVEQLAAGGFPVQLGGAVGNLDKLAEKGAVIRLAVASELGLVDEPQWQSQRDRVAEFAGLLSLIAGSLGKLGQDIALLAQSGGEIELSGGGGSSAMAHKQNPVGAEVLVSLARFNATQVSGLHHSLVHEQERSGAAWTLEWLILPQMVMATGAALRIVTELLTNIRSLGSQNS
jgi:3-carboxy-cis,cis-muconate cycloisomerase